MGAVDVEAVLFDFGGVVLTSPFEAFAHHETEHGLPEGFLRRLNATDPDDNAWARLERSEVDVDGFADLFEAEARAAGHEVDARAVLALLHGEVRPAMVEALRRIKEHGLPLALLTNNIVSEPASEPMGTGFLGAPAPSSSVPPSGGSGEVVHETHGPPMSDGVEPRADVADALALFDVVVESSKAGVRKPDPRFYELALEQVGVEAEAAVFLDDLGVNLKPARALGMRTIKVVDPAAALAELEAVLGFGLS